jgi:hypothetical protein
MQEDKLGCGHNAQRILSPTVRWHATRYGLFKAGVKRVGI